MRELTQYELDHVSGGWRFGAAMVVLANSNDRNGDGDGFDETSSDLFAGAAATGSAAWAAA